MKQEHEAMTEQNQPPFARGNSLSEMPAMDIHVPWHAIPRAEEPALQSSVWQEKEDACRLVGGFL